MVLGEKKKLIESSQADKDDVSSSQKVHSSERYGGAISTKTCDSFKMVLLHIELACSTMAVSI